MSLKKRISNWLKEYLEESNLETFVVGVSGGIDSAVVSTLCALTGKPTIAATLPIKSSEKNNSYARKHLRWLTSNFNNVSDKEIHLDFPFYSFTRVLENLGYNNELAVANSKSRMRMMTLYALASNNNGLVVGTGNKVEDFGVGFFTKYGDGGVDISPIADLFKSEVRSLAKELNILDEIIHAEPTDGLWEDDRTDENQIGASYEELEWAMNYSGLEKIDTRQEEVLSIYNSLHKKNLHKMRSIPIFTK